MEIKNILLIIIALIVAFAIMKLFILIIIALIVAFAIMKLFSWLIPVVIGVVIGLLIYMFFKKYDQ